MKAKWLRIGTPIVIICLLLLAALAYFPILASHAVKASSPTPSTGARHFTKMQMRLMSGFLANGLDDRNADAATTPAPKNYFPSHGDDQCALSRGSNVKVNQNCLNLTDTTLQGRAQANNETSIAVDPLHPNHMVASYNDYRRGDGNCYGAYSLDGGTHWNDTTVPMSFTLGTAFGGAAREYWQAGGDTSVAWDTKGNAYFSCQVFNRGLAVSPNPDQSSAFYVFRSTANNGASWNFPGHPVVEHNDVVGAGTVLEDKQLMTVDNHVGSPFQDRVYVTYTEFAADGTAYIYESYSKDYGQTFSPRTVVSATSPLCTNTFGLPTPNGTCNENQFSQPFTGSDGALYVTWANFNNTVTGSDNRNQMLLAKSTDGGATFSAPVKVGDYYDLPDCATYQGGADAGRACVPEKGATTNSIFRATNYPVGAVNPKNKHQVVVTFGSYINRHSNESNGCVPTGLSPTTGLNLYTGVKTKGACNNDILVSVSNDGGATFTGTTTDPRRLTSVNQASGQATTDQFWQWTTFTPNGKLVTSYYDRQYGNDETTGYSDVSLSSSSNLTKFATVRATSSSMPPPTEFAGVFFGDYTGMDVASNSTAFPIWMDTRSKDLFLCPNTGVPGVAPAVCTGVEANGLTANDQDAFTAAIAIP